MINFKIEISVEEPFSSGYNSAAPLTHVLSLNKSRNFLFWLICYSILIDSEYVSNFKVFPHHNVVKVIWFFVRVPVLSEQILLAPPIVSQAYIFLTKFWSTSIFLTENANERVTANGSPSGIATTMTVIARIKKLRS